MTIYKNSILLALMLITSFNLLAQQDKEVQLHKEMMVNIWQDVYPEFNIMKLSDVDAIYDKLTNAQVLSIDLTSYKICLEHRAERRKLINAKAQKHENARKRIREASQKEFDEMMRNPDDEIRAMIEDKDKKYIPGMDLEDEKGKHCYQLINVLDTVSDN